VPNHFNFDPISFLINSIRLTWFLFVFPCTCAFRHLWNLALIVAAQVLLMITWVYRIYSMFCCQYYAVCTVQSTLIYYLRFWRNTISRTYYRHPSHPSHSPLALQFVLFASENIQRRFILLSIIDNESKQTHNWNLAS